MSVKEKIQQYLDYKGISPTAAERELGWSVGAFTKAKSITVDRAKEFLLFFKDLSAEWLLRDEGEMTRDEKSSVSSRTSNLFSEDSQFYKRIIDEQLDTIKMLRTKVREYEEKAAAEKERQIGA